MVISGLLIAGLPVPVKPIPPRLPPAWITLAVRVGGWNRHLTAASGDGDQRFAHRRAARAGEADPTAAAPGLDHPRGHGSRWPGTRCRPPGLAVSGLRQIGRASC